MVIRFVIELDNPLRFSVNLSGVTASTLRLSNQKEIVKHRMLTKTQRKVLNFIKRYINKHGYGPSLEEIGERALDGASISAAHQHVEILWQKGFLKKLPHQPRSIGVYKEGEDVVEVPLLGAIALGEPIEEIANPEPLEVPKTITCGSGDHYALVAKGESMKNLGILDGDILVVRHQTTADNGDIVVALVEGGATLKKFYDHGNRIELRPAWEAFEPKFYSKGLIEVQGKFCGLLRKGSGW